MIEFLTRRNFLYDSACGLGSLALSSLLQEKSLAADLPKPHFPPRAKNCIFLFMEGGPSHIDLFDPKPELNKLAGKPLPESFGKVITAMGEAGAPLLASKRSWKQYGQGGLWISDWLP